MKESFALTMLDGNRDAYSTVYSGPEPAAGLHKLAAVTKATIALASGPPLPVGGGSFPLGLPLGMPPLFGSS